MSALVAVVVRTLLLAGLSWLTYWVVDLGMSEEEAGANIGGGLLILAVVIVVSSVWALLDTMSTGAWLRTALVWLAVGVLVGVLAALQSQDFSADLDRDVLISDLTSVTPFIAGLVVVPAALGALLGRALRESRTR